MVSSVINLILSWCHLKPTVTHKTTLDINSQFLAQFNLQQIHSKHFKTAIFFCLPQNSLQKLVVLFEFGEWVISVVLNARDQARFCRAIITYVCITTELKRWHIEYIQMDEAYTIHSDKNTHAILSISKDDVDCTVYMYLYWCSLCAQQQTHCCVCATERACVIQNRILYNEMFVLLL